MEPTANYINLLKESWTELQNWAVDCRFDPKTEADIQCFLYHCLIEKLATAKGIHAEYPHEEGDTDLVIDDKVFVEIVYILRSGKRTKGSWGTRTRNVKEEIEKLEALKKRRSNITGVLAVFSKTYIKDDEPWYDDVREYCEKSGIKMLRALKRKVDR
jgi:hypothetical protein